MYLRIGNKLFRFQRFNASVKLSADVAAAVASAFFLGRIVIGFD